MMPLIAYCSEYHGRCFGIGKRRWCIRRVNIRQYHDLSGDACGGTHVTIIGAIVVPADRADKIRLTYSAAGDVTVLRIEQEPCVFAIGSKNEAPKLGGRMKIRSGFLFSATGRVLEWFVRPFLIGYNGKIRTTKYLPWPVRSTIANHLAYRDWAQIALIVANQYPGGDYFEFGSESLRTFTNFLSAFHLNGHDAGMPDVKFYAFDIFGEPKPEASLSEEEKPYFAVYRSLGARHYRQAFSRFRRHGLLLDRCVLVKGHFEDTLNDSFKAKLRQDNRRVGFAFLDCNIPSSYKTCLDFLVDYIREDRAFVYLDEYFQIPGVADLFDDFCKTVKEKYGLKVRYVRDAGAFGALFSFITSAT
jgi:Macrocin-O-methyltransferase (TylF)